MDHIKTGRRLVSGVHARAAALAALLGVVSFASSARAQSEDGSGKDPDDSLAAEQQAKDEQEQGDGAPGDKVEAVAPAPEAADDNAPLERDGKTYRFIGARFRNVIVPKFMVNFFADGGSTVNVFTVGPEFVTRRDGLEIDLAISYADYSMDPFLFKGKQDDNFAWEMVSSDLKLLYLTADILFVEIPLDKEKGRFSVQFGAGVGIGVVFGNLYRAQAYPNDPSNLNPDDVGAWSKCAGPSGAFCDASNNHYGNYDEPSWVNGGSKPSVFPWISFPQVSFRYKPIKQLQTRLDTGFSITGFYFGLSAGYGL
ncbi:hypothetical protein SOCE26_005760 [Sorangium cellulosum]|uniref:Secreted protein n=1 Tax=Sorangium cellulosum TaxID=56 RepID=A0A2L0EIU9_SORCE|nr:hypothetical protein [Sorangium cellulosum]AUX39194.1 hypothetical protein SOCE26_005760 [Sorangium cellulosum]